MLNNLELWFRNRKSIVINIFIYLTLIECVAILLILLPGRSDPTTSLLFGYSATRLVSILIVVLIGSFSANLSFKLRKDKAWATDFSLRINKLFSESGTGKYLTALIIITLVTSVYFVFYVIFAPLIVFGPNPFFIRFLPIILLLSVISFQALLCILIIRDDLVGDDYQINKMLSFIRIGIYLFFLSLAVRLIFAIPVIANNTQPRFDEASYIERAVGYELTIKNLVSGKYADRENLLVAYGEGRWPPLHAFMLGLGGFLTKNLLAAGRLSLVFISALTTPIVYLLAKKAVNEKAALPAAMLHVFYPSFISYSHLLWSETTYIFLLLLSIVLFIDFLETKQRNKKLVLAVLIGVILGFGGLTRAAIIPYVLAIAIWMFIKESKRRFLFPRLFIAAWFMTVLPWLSVISIQEKSFMPLATTGSYNLYLGNNPWESEGAFSEDSRMNSSASKVRAAINYYYKKNSVHPETAARILAVKEILANPEIFIRRSADRFGSFLGGSFFEIRHLTHAAYPLVPDALIIILWIIFLLAFIIFLSLTMLGFVANTNQEFPYRTLLIVMAITGWIVPTFVLARSRFFLPTLAILTPVAGIGLLAMRNLITAKRKMFFSFLIILIGTPIILSLPDVVANGLRPSIYYAKLIHTFENVSQTNAVFSDRFIFKSLTERTDPITITIMSKGYFFGATDRQDFLWEVSGRLDEIQLIIYSTNATVPLEIMLSSEDQNLSVLIHPVQKDNWWNWKPTGLPEIEYLWAGGF